MPTSEICDMLNSVSGSVEIAARGLLAALTENTPKLTIPEINFDEVCERLLCRQRRRQTLLIRRTSHILPDQLALARDCVSFGLSGMHGSASVG